MTDFQNGGFLFGKMMTEVNLVACSFCCLELQRHLFIGILKRDYIRASPKLHTTYTFYFNHIVFLYSFISWTFVSNTFYNLYENQQLSASMG